MFRIVIDTNLLVGALLQRGGTNRRIIRACLEGRLSPLVGQTLLLEYEDVLGRTRLFQRSPLSGKERQELLAALLAVSEWVHVYYSWRPDLPDEADNHLMELAVAGGATRIVTNNVRDFQRADLRFPGIRILSPAEMWKELP